MAYFETNASKMNANEKVSFLGEGNYECRVRREHSSLNRNNNKNHNNRTEQKKKSTTAINVDTVITVFNKQILFVEKEPRAKSFDGGT